MFSRPAEDAVATRSACGLLILTLLAGLAAGQSGPTLGTIVMEEVIVRGSPRTDGPDCGTLRRGSTVVVHREIEGSGWLAIQPPPGSISWINHLFVELEEPEGTTFPQNAIVTADGPVKLAAGRPGVREPLEVRHATVPKGTILLVIGEKVQTASDDIRTKWYPIVPPADDFRYLPKEAVQLDGPAGAGFVVKSPNSSPTVPSASRSSPTMMTGKPAGWPSHTLWVQAEAAEQAGELDKAERLYFDLARQMNAPGGDADLANLCYTRIHAIRERRRQGENTRRTEPAWRGEATRRVDSPSAETPRGQWSGIGYLRKVTAFTINGQTVYALEDSRYRVQLYAIAAAGVELDRYIRKQVDLYGLVQYPEQLKGIGVMTVTRVDPVK